MGVKASFSHSVPGCKNALLGWPRSFGLCLRLDISIPKNQVSIPAGKRGDQPLHPGALPLLLHRKWAQGTGWREVGVCLRPLAPAALPRLGTPPGVCAWSPEAVCAMAAADESSVAVLPPREKLYEEERLKLGFRSTPMCLKPLILHPLNRELNTLNICAWCLCSKKSNTQRLTANNRKGR